MFIGSFSVFWALALPPLSCHRTEKEEGIWFHLTLLPFPRGCSGSVARARGWGSVRYLKLPSSPRRHCQHTGRHQWVRCSARFACSTENARNSPQRPALRIWMGRNNRPLQMRAGLSVSPSSSSPHLTSSRIASRVAELLQSVSRVSEALFLIRKRRVGGRVCGAARRGAARLWRRAAGSH